MARITRLTLTLALALAAPFALAEDDKKPVEAAPAGTAKAAEPAAQVPAPGVVPASPGATATEAAPWTSYEINIGAIGRDPDTSSSKFQEYRSIPNSAWVPFLRFQGTGGAFDYDFSARNVGQDDGYYRLKAGSGPVEAVATFQQIPHRFGGEAKSLLAASGANFTFADQRALQARLESVPRSAINFAFLNNLLQPYVSGLPIFDIRLKRSLGSLDVNLTKDKPVDVRFTYFIEDREGNRGSGTSFGFGNVVETAEPIDYRTQDMALNAEWANSWGALRGGFRYNWFGNSNLVQTFQNPFRFTDATDASAYQAPGSASIAGASFGRLALPPDNKSITGSLGVTLKLAGKTRLYADGSYGQWTQDEAFIPFTSNTAIRIGSTGLAATDVNNLPARSLDGKIDVMSFSGGVVSRPIPGLSLIARYRRYDLDNKTPRIEFHEGYVRFDGVWEDIPRVNVPYGYTSDAISTSAAYTIGDVTLEGGYKYDRFARTFREVSHTSQDTIYGSAYLRAADWAVLRVTYEQATRDFEEADLHIERSEHASYLESEGIANLLAADPDQPQTGGGTLCPPGTVCNLRYDQARKDTDRILGSVQLTPGGNTTFVFTYGRGKDDYTETIYGLVEAENESFTAEADYTPNDRFTVFGFYTRENLSNFQRGRQSGATVSVNPLDEWTSDANDTADTFGGGTTIGVVKDTVDLTFTGTYQKVDGENLIFARPGGAAFRGGAVSLPLYDDTKLLTLMTEIGYKFQGGLRLGVGGWLEDYELRDPFSVGSVNYLPASFFLAGNDGDYRAYVFFTRLSYVW